MSQSIFDGDGRVVVQPTFRLPGTQPIPVTRSAARRTIEAFESNGRSNHSLAGSTLWVTLQHCADTATPYLLNAYPGMGFEVTKAPPLD